MQDTIVTLFIQFGLAGLIGFAIGLERAMAGQENPHAGTRDFIMVALVGAVSAHAAILFDTAWLVVAGFAGFFALLVSGYWNDRRKDSGITTEMAAILTFFLGVLIIMEATEIAIALAITTLAVLSQKQAIHGISRKIQTYELQAAVKFLVITFIILPVLPNTPLSTYLTQPLGEVVSIDPDDRKVKFEITGKQGLEKGDTYKLYTPDHIYLGLLTIEEIDNTFLSGPLEADGDVSLQPESEVHSQMEITWFYTMLDALNPYMIWLIVVLVSFISFVGYVLVKVLGTGAGISLTGLVGGLASSTVTTVSFARRSREMPKLNLRFGVAILLASSVMFPRLLLEIAVVNRELMKNMALPIVVMGVTGLLMAAFSLRKVSSDRQGEETVSLENPFCLKSAVTFGLIFSLILIMTRMATVYLGNQWLPLVAVISGLVDVDAIAFSLSDAQQSGIISLNWASFNLVLGTISNTFVKLFIVLSMGNRQLFRRLLLSFVIISASGILTTLLYYDF